MRFLFYQLLTVLILISAHMYAEVKEIKTERELREILSQKKPVCIMFYAPWCSACKAMKEPFKGAASVFKKEVIFAKVDAANNTFKEIADSFGIEAIPTIIFKQVGALTQDQLVNTVNGFLYTKSVKEAPKKNGTKKPEVKKKAVADKKKNAKKPQKSSKKSTK